MVLVLSVTTFDIAPGQVSPHGDMKTRFMLSATTVAGSETAGLLVEVRTTRKYPCAGSTLKLTTSHSNDTISVHVEGVERPNPCLQVESEAVGKSFIGSLLPGEYVLRVLDRASTDFYRVVIDNSGFVLKPKEGTFTSIDGGRSIGEAKADTIAPPKQRAIKIFVDCSPNCYQDYIKTELPMLDYVRDKELANLHLLITSQPAGNGGYEHALMFIGLREFSGMLDTLKFFSGASDTDDMLQRKLLKTLKLGLVRYIAKTALAEQADVYFSGEQDLTEAADDPWNNWVFSTDHSVTVRGQKSTNAVQLYSSFSANHITEQWKVRAGFDVSYAENRYSIAGGEYRSLARGYALKVLVARSLSAHWSAGGISSLTSSTYDNTRMWFIIGPALEYNIFPYSESTRRQSRILYRLGLHRLNYFDETIFYRTDETLTSHSLSVALDLKEPWGRASVAVEGSQYFHDLSKNRLEFSGELSLRVWEGFSLLLSGYATLIHDQLSLPAFGASPEEILLQRRELATTYSYYASVGVSYTFGSIYSNIVNPRFGK
jgi:hypothetical protein